MQRERDPLAVSRVIGDVLDPFTRSVPLMVLYNRRAVTNGCEFKPSAVAEQPRIEVGGSDLSTIYTLIMVDPDAPTPSDPSLREYLHWLVTNIPARGEASFGQEIVSYESPRPLLGIHRFVFVLFKQQSPSTAGVCAPGWRQNFNTRDFAELYNLGSPVAAVYFNCQRESGSGQEVAFSKIIGAEKGMVSLNALQVEKVKIPTGFKCMFVEYLKRQASETKQILHGSL